MNDPARYSVRLSNGSEFGPATMDIIAQWSREGRVPMDALLVHAETSEVRSVLSEPAIQTFLHAPPTVSTGVQPPSDSPLSGMIPYKNPHALWGYYVGIISWLPLVGLFAGPTAIVLGIIGLRRRLKEPQLRGLAHAWIAIIMGSIGTLISLGCSASIIAAVLNN